MTAEAISVPAAEPLPDGYVRHAARSSLIAYASLCDRRYKPSRVHRFIASKLEQVASGKIRRLILNMPPQHGKSRLCSAEFPSWLLGRDPSVKFANASYSADLPVRNSRETRERMRSPEYQGLFDTRLASDNAGAESWMVRGGGGYRAVGVGGALTGHSVDVMVIDDPFKDYAEAHSPTVRERVWDWFTSTVFTRLSPNGSCVVIMTRWHPGDLAGRLMDPSRKAELADAGVDSEGWELIKLPGIAKENDPLGRKPGEALFPEKYNVGRLKAIQAVLGSYKYGALYDQEPVAKGGNYVNMGAFRIVDPAQVPTGLRWVRFWDVAATEAREASKADPDYTAGVKGAIGPSGELYLADMVTGQWKWPQSRERIRAIGESERILIGFESVSGFKTAFDNLVEVMPSGIKVDCIGVDADKLTRALPWIALAEAGKVNLVRGPWNLPFMAEAEAFPIGAHDDMVDAVSGVYKMLAGGRRIFLA